MAVSEVRSRPGHLRHGLENDTTRVRNTERLSHRIGRTHPFYERVLFHDTHKSSPVTNKVQIGVSGHQDREGVDWTWVETTIRSVLDEQMPIDRVFTCLAIGTDQVFARQAMELGIPVTAVIPLDNYEDFFKGTDLSDYKSMLSRCEVIELRSQEQEQQAFFDAGRLVADRSQILVALWDGKPSEGLGGTADIVQYCLEKGQRVIHLEPFSQTIRNLESTTDSDKTQPE